MNNLSNNKKIIMVIFIITLIGIGYYIYNNLEYNNNQIGKDENKTLISNNEQNNTNIIDDKVSNKIIVHITGEIKNPGIVELEEGERIFNVIEKAGGTTKDADTSKINLAQIVEDGMKINIPNKNDKTEANENINIDTTSNSINIKKENENKIVNINTATQTELETLPGIGPSIASKIINYRKEKGKFTKIEDIKNVNGIGDAKFEKIKSLICVKNKF